MSEFQHRQIMARELPLSGSHPDKLAATYQPKLALAVVQPHAKA
ncbi:hypothetical protein [Ochrobactrum sp. EDr1-4]